MDETCVSVREECNEIAIYNEAAWFLLKQRTAIN